jgi:hypothetical protein
MENKQELIDVRKQYCLACEKYVELFCIKHGYPYEPFPWASGDVGGIACIGDYFVDMATIRVDIDENVREEEFIQWYDYCLEASEFGFTTPNFRSWVNGCPRVRQESLNKIKGLKDELHKMIEDEKRKYGSA